MSLHRASTPARRTRRRPSRLSSMPSPRPWPRARRSPSAGSACSSGPSVPRAPTAPRRPARRSARWPRPSRASVPGGDFKATVNSEKPAAAAQKVPQGHRDRGARRRPRLRPPPPTKAAPAKKAAAKKAAAPAKKAAGEGSCPGARRRPAKKAPAKKAPAHEGPAPRRPRRPPRPGRPGCGGDARRGVADHTRPHARSDQSAGREGVLPWPGSAGPCAQGSARTRRRRFRPDRVGRLPSPPCPPR